VVLFNYSTKELTAKIVYYGPGLCGKTTNLRFIHESLPGDRRGRMLSLATQTDRTLYFDFLPVELGEIRGLKTRVQLYTVPGQVFYNETRKMVLKGVDGVVFVADSQGQMADANVESYRNLAENLRANGLDLATMPLVLQFNKRDLPGVLSVDAMNAALNRTNSPFYEAIATTGIGVHDTLKAVTKLVLLNLSERYQDSAAVARFATPPPAVAPPAIPTGGSPALSVPSAAWESDEDLEAELEQMDALEIEDLIEEVDTFDSATVERPAAARAPGNGHLAAAAAPPGDASPSDENDFLSTPAAAELAAFLRPESSPSETDFDSIEPAPDLPAAASAMDDFTPVDRLQEAGPNAESWRSLGSSVRPDELETLEEEPPVPSVSAGARPVPGSLPTASPAPTPGRAPEAVLLSDGQEIRLPLRIRMEGRVLTRILTVRLEPEGDRPPERLPR
jgi:mutual gliding-motility protein MglA